ncbi:hypothetical protein AGOR_G00194810 [Albula goreensis]|uniref:Ig-like domain-containing protein n=1 Tax=Albula goreensis TaxID=1534307 RepID=A0A8T3CU23_9TELE|nr:hypothetical protein AGOR_G00194810 [Albula goreensis]
MKHMTVFLGFWVFAVCMPSGQSEVKELKCIVGKMISFPIAVKIEGFIFKNDRHIGKVTAKNFHTADKTFRGRLQWDSSTGLFSITGLRLEDSGKYKVQNQNGGIPDTVYQLKVYNPASTPQVSSRNKMKPTCSVLCCVENGREVTLSWQREGETLNSTSSPDLNTPLSLPLEIEENSAPYSCVAANPVSNMTVTVRPEEFCFGSVSKPRITAEGYQGRYCSLRCSVENGREVTLSWLKEGDILDHKSSPDLNTPLSLPLEIEENSAPVPTSTYSCVATNPVSNRTLAVKPEDYCIGEML